MKNYSTDASIPNRLCLPILDQFPDVPIMGEVVFFNQYPREGIYIFVGDGWKPLFSTENNIWASPIIAEPEQVIFELDVEYNTDGKSINVYKDGIRLDKTEYAEVANNMIAWKGDELPGGEKFEFQIFNKKIHSVFDIKAFNRRKGIC